MIRKRAIMSCIYSRSHLLIPKYSIIFYKFKVKVFFSSADPTTNFRKPKSMNLPVLIADWRLPHRVRPAPMIVGLQQI
jgi:hypothetical protein